MASPFFIDLDGGWLSERIVVPNDLDESAVARRAVLGDNDSVAGALFGASAT